MCRNRSVAGLFAFDSILETFSCSNSFKIMHKHTRYYKIEARHKHNPHRNSKQAVNTIMTSIEPASTKRRKRSHNDTSLSAVANIAHLPSAALIHITSYLKSPPISRALLAVAIAKDADSLSQDSIVSGIVGDDWGTLDFGEIEKDLAAKLSDTDFSGVLHCIDAVNTVKKLRLTNCISIIGSCLRRFVALE